MSTVCLDPGWAVEMSFINCISEKNGVTMPVGCEPRTSDIRL